jgi:hypothetical protein
LHATGNYCILACAFGLRRHPAGHARPRGMQETVSRGAMQSILALDRGGLWRARVMCLCVTGAMQSILALERGVFGGAGGKVGVYVSGLRCNPFGRVPPLVRPPN